jgi:molybdopterin converting factor small subunit
MAISIQIPTALRSYADGNAAVEVDAATAGAALDALIAAHPNLGNHLRTADGALRSFVNIYLNDEDIRYLGKEETAVQDGDTLTIVPSIAGGHWA